MNLTIISIIIPVYNTGNYLHQCIDSILNQSFKDFELLLIDDGSSDLSGTVCDEYALKDNRVRVWHQANRGVSAARNLGLQHAKGQWIYFPDSDDIVWEDAFKYMIGLIREQSAFVIAGYEVYNEGGKCTYACAERKQHTITKNDALMEMFAPTDYRYQGYLWNKLFKADIIRDYNISFVQNIKFNEDRLFNVEYLCRIKGDVEYSTTPVYKYIERPTGAMSSLSQRFNPYFLTDLDAFVLMKRALVQCHAKRDIINAHARAMNYSVDRYYSVCSQFGVLSLRRILEAEKRFLKGVGIGRQLEYQVRKIKRIIIKLCTKS